MNPISAWLAKFRLVLILVLFASLLGAIAVQTVRLSSAQTDFAKLETQVAQERQARADQRTKDEQTARATEQQLADQADKARREAHEKERVLSARVTQLVRLLRDRPARPEAGSEVAATPGPGSGGTGAGLYRDDSQFLVWLAADAAKRAIERDTCRRKYDDARDALSKGQPK